MSDPLVAPVVRRGVPDPGDLLDKLPDDVDDIPLTPGWVKDKVVGSLAEKVMTGVVYGAACALMVTLIGIGAWKITAPKS